MDDESAMKEPNQEEEEEEDEESLEKLQEEIARMEEEAARLSKETEEISGTTESESKEAAAAAADGKQPARDSCSVYVGQVDYSATPEELLAHFGACGTVERVTIVCDKFTGKPKGFAYLEFENEAAAENAIKLNDSEFKGRQLKVTSKRVNQPGFYFQNADPSGRGGGRGGRGFGRGPPIRGRGRGFGRGGRGGGGPRGGGGRGGGFRGGGRGGYHPYY